MSNNKFDLERFKAGECAEDEDYERYFLADLPDGIIAYKFRDKKIGNWRASSRPLEWFEENTTMQPREEWAVLYKSFDQYTSFDEAEDVRLRLNHPEDYITVKIVRP